MNDHAVSAALSGEYWLGLKVCEKYASLAIWCSFSGSLHNFFILPRCRKIMCRKFHPGPRAFPKCTRSPNQHLSCYLFEPPVMTPEWCPLRYEPGHEPQNVRPASSTARQGNCPNHRKPGEWYQDGKKFTNPKTGGAGPGGVTPANVQVK